MTTTPPRAQDGAPGASRSEQAPRTSVIVRAKDSGGTIRQTLSSLRAQTVRTEIIVVDSGSTDDTLDIAAEHAARIIAIPPADFSFGRALNIGAAACQTDVVFALSSHCVAPSSTWVEIALRHYEVDDVLATNGALRSQEGVDLAGPYRLTAATRRPGLDWGFSNHAASWRADVWAAEPFREDLAACEDREWSWRVMSSLDGAIVFDPNLYVDAGHRRSAGLRPLWSRVSREHEVLAELEGEAPTARRAFHTWWSEFPYPSSHPTWLRRASPHRTVEIAAAFAGARRGVRKSARG